MTRIGGKSNNSSNADGSDNRLRPAGLTTPDSKRRRKYVAPPSDDGVSSSDDSTYDTLLTETAMTVASCSDDGPESQDPFAPAAPIAAAIPAVIPVWQGNLLHEGGQAQLIRDQKRVILEDIIRIQEELLRSVPRVHLIARFDLLNNFDIQLRF